MSNINNVASPEMNRKVFDIASNMSNLAVACLEEDLDRILNHEREHYSAEDIERKEAELAEAKKDSNTLLSYLASVQNGPVYCETELRDWRFADGYTEDDLPANERDTYILKVKQAEPETGVYFTLYSKQLEELNTTETLNGFSGLIEIRNGKPAISLGLNDNEHILHVMSDISHSLQVIPDSDTSNRPIHGSVTYNNMTVEGSVYPDGNTAWLENARLSIAENIFANRKFINNLHVEDDSRWKHEGGYWNKIVFFENPDSSMPSIMGFLEVIFAPESAFVLDVSDGII